MKKTILTLGKALKKVDQKKINGGISIIIGGPSTCCDPNLSCCTTTHLAIYSSSCGGTYKAGCQYHYSSGCCI